MNSKAQKARPFMCSLVQNTPMYWATNWATIWSALWLQGSAPCGYSFLTAGQVTMPPPSPRPKPREPTHVRPTHRHAIAQQLPAIQAPSSTVYFEPKSDTRRLKVLGETRQSASVRLSNWNLLTRNGRKCYNSYFICPSSKWIRV